LLHNPAEETKKCPPLGQQKEKVLLFDDINNNTAHRLEMRKIARDLQKCASHFFTTTTNKNEGGKDVRIIRSGWGREISAGRGLN